jgi:hypothetical protein
VKDDKIFGEGDPFDEASGGAAAAPKRKPRNASQQHIGCPLAWLEWVFPLVRSKEQLVVALYIYRRSIVCHSKTVSLANRELQQLFGISRFTKSRALAELRQAGVITTVQQDGQAVRVTLAKKRRR